MARRSHKSSVSLLVLEDSQASAFAPSARTASGPAAILLASYRSLQTGQRARAERIHATGFSCAAATTLEVAGGARGRPGPAGGGPRPAAVPVRAPPRARGRGQARRGPLAAAHGRRAGRGGRRA